jgi:type II secretory pathway pseudopilin PulG
LRNSAELGDHLESAPLGRGCKTVIVIAALLLLAGLFFPSVSRPGPDAHRRTRALNDLANITTALKYYVTEYGTPPAGDRAQIMAALRGSNPRSIIFFEARPESFNSRGELIDPWKEPYWIDTSNPDFPWGYSFGRNGRDEGGVPGSDDVPSWR